VVAEKYKHNIRVAMAAYGFKRLVIEHTGALLIEPAIL
jgi:hypothetical protein